MRTGTVKWFNTRKGYGYITPIDGGFDVYVQIDAVERAGLIDLKEGQKINFEIVVDQRHFAENAFRAQSFEATAAAPDLDPSTHDDKELVTLFAFPEDRVSFREGPGRDLRPQEKTEINLVA